MPEIQYFVAFALNRRNTGSDRPMALDICEKWVVDTIIYFILAVMILKSILSHEM